MYKKFGILLIVLLFAGTAMAQRTRQCDVDSLAVSTTATRATYAVTLETAVFKFVGCTGHLKMAFTYQDTTWSDKKWFVMADGSSLSVAKSKEHGIPGIKKILYKCASGTGALVVVSSRTGDGT